MQDNIKYNYQHGYRRSSNCCSRRKWILLVTLTSCAVLFILTRNSFIERTETTKKPARDTYVDDVPADLYRKVLHTWYNFSDDPKWYNNVNISALSAEDYKNLLTDVRQNWITWNYDPKKSYALQNPNVKDPSRGQSNAIRQIFNDKKTGFFIECGAFDGETRSNTLFLERHNGWSGLLIEADPISFTKMLQKNRKAYLSPTCLSLTKSPTVASFRMAKNVGRLAKNTEKNVHAKTPDVPHTGNLVHVQCLPLMLYIATLGIETIDYFSLDIEGDEIDVLETIPFDEINIKTLSVEYIHDKKGQKYMIDMMERLGYYVHSFVKDPQNYLANDIIFVKRDDEK